MTETSDFYFLISFNQNNPSLPVLIELVNSYQAGLHHRASFQKASGGFEDFFQ